MVYASDKIAALIEQAERLRLQNCPVLIQGETGTGKELIAQAVHGGRGPFVVVDCTHLTPQLAESELFGHVRGAFTSADSGRPGLIDAANGGAAFFDEIGELALEVQAKLLRLLQQKTYRRVGSARELHSNFRIITATNRDLKREVSAGRFRQDLYYRLNVAKLHVPPLRERKEDIPVLISHFLSGSNFQIPDHVLGYFLSYDWPGNVRELENCIQRIRARSSGNLVKRSDLPSTICAPNQLIPGLRDLHATEPGLEGNTCSNWTHVPLLPMHELERLAIMRALDETGGDRQRAAQLLQIGRTTLFRRLREIEKRPE
ncbi:MAG: sigma-54-dependent Fis family transcriptional regulator [Acidobacteriaceae bacterium]|nr:sigma-54-dependent Fis family transcriptional regulator [Acidobacteriaceae bacterium]